MSVRVLTWIEDFVSIILGVQNLRNSLAAYVYRKVCEFIRSQTTGEENQEFKVQEIY